MKSFNFSINNRIVRPSLRSILYISLLFSLTTIQLFGVGSDWVICFDHDGKVNIESSFSKCRDSSKILRETSKKSISLEDTLCLSPCSDLSFISPQILPEKKLKTIPPTLFVSSQLRPNPIRSLLINPRKPDGFIQIFPHLKSIRSTILII